MSAAGRPTPRPARPDDLDAFLSLLAHCAVSRPAKQEAESERIWASLMAREGLTVFVSPVENQLVATCTLITAPNLLRAGRAHAFLENVATHRDWQGRGHGRAVVSCALDAAWAANCHQVLLQSGRADPRVHQFYEKLGFVPGLRTAYCAHRPDEI
ncbi:GNAT family N-acetyltransferase [Novosphingobium sp. 1949]|uniref:GNAT family N-acetyltransferase n=1 Tax=Novosphingobium organovorum TaxID=2930092 RepID=A0ABT0B9L1_9SPHN|nr:GNAT family N-acetyltransferase [Novosphingobium organovorum]MCJ2181629.1 GNAT family N-acetyltransferase [Novosphingobium organovorum]